MPVRSARNRKLRRMLYGSGIVAFLGFSVWFVFGERGVMKILQLRRDWQALNAQEVELRMMRDSLNAYLAALQAGDPLALERAAREHGLVASNETIVKVQVDSTR